VKTKPRTTRTEGTARTPGRWRAPVSALLITLGCVLAPVAVLGVWAANQVSNTDRYVANMAPLISNPSIQHALSDKITAEVTSRVDVPALTSQLTTELSSAHLPRLATLVHNFSGPIANVVDGFISSTVTKVVASPAVATLWVQANRTAHQGLVKVLSGQGNGAVSVVNGHVVLNIGPIVAQVKNTLVARGLGAAAHIPTVNATFPLFAAPNLEKAQRGSRVITTLRWVLPVLSLALMGIGIFLAWHRRRGLLGAALGLSASMLVLAAALAIGRAIYLNSIPTSVLPADAAGAAYDILIRFIREGLRLLLVIGLIVAAGAYLAGPSTTAVRVRKAVWAGLDWIRAKSGRAGTSAGPVRRWTAAHKTVLRAGAVGIAVLVFVFWGQPSLTLVIWLVVLLLVVLGVIELVGGRTVTATAEAASATASASPTTGGAAPATPAATATSATAAMPVAPSAADQPTTPIQSIPATVPKQSPTSTDTAVPAAATVPTQPITLDQPTTPGQPSTQSQPNQPAEPTTSAKPGGPASGNDAPT